MSTGYSSLTPAALFRRFFSHAGLYGLSIVLARAGWLFLLPLFWIKLEPSDFGVIGIAQVVQSLLVPVLSLGLADAAQRLLLEWPEAERRQRLFTLVLASVLAGGALCLALDFVGALLFGIVFSQVPFHPFLRIAVWTAFFANLAMIPLAVIRLRERVLAFSLLTIGGFLAQALVGLLLVLRFDMGAQGFLIGSLAGAAISALLSLVALAPELRPGLSPVALKDSLRYGLPTAAALLLESVAGILDRYFLDKFVPLAQIGLYNLANQLGSAFNVFNQAFKTSWFPFLYRAASERDDVAVLVSRFAPIYLALLAVPALAVALLAEEFVNYFGGARYEGVYPLVPFFVLYYYIGAVIAAVGRGMDLAKRTAPWPLVPTAGLLVSAVALFLLVPRFGVWGAAGAILLGALTRATVQIGLSLRALPRPLYPERLLGVIACAAFAFVIARWSAPAGLIGAVAVKSAIIAASALPLLWVGAGFPSPSRAMVEVRAFLHKDREQDAT